MPRQVFENMIVKKHSSLKYYPDTTFTKEEFEQERDKFLRKLKKNVESYFYLKHENFDKKVFQVFKNEFVNYIDYFLKNKDNLTRIKLIKRNHEIFLNNSENVEKNMTRDSILNEELQDNLKDLDYIDNPQNLWNDLDTKIRNMFIERYIGIGYHHD
jgi:hypothetical protein